MADRTVKVNLLANVLQFERGMNNAADAADNARRAAERFERDYRGRASLDTKDVEKGLRRQQALMDKFYNGLAKERDKAGKAERAEINRLGKLAQRALKERLAEEQRASNQAAADELARQKHAMDVWRYEMGEGLKDIEARNKERARLEKEAADAEAAAAKKRSDASKKGWETRRKQAEQEAAEQLERQKYIMAQWAAQQREGEAERRRVAAQNARDAREAAQAAIEAERERTRVAKAEAAERARVEREEAKQKLAYNRAVMAQWAREQREGSAEADRNRAGRESASIEAAKVRVDTSGAEADLAELRRELNALDRDEASPEVNLQIDKALLDARRIENELNRLSQQEASPEADLKADRAHFQIQQLRTALQRLDTEKVEPKVTADVTDARNDLQAINAQLSALNTRKASPEAELKIIKFRQAAIQIERDLARLDGMEASADVDLQTALARAKLAAIQAELRRFDGQTFRATVDIDTNMSRSRLAMLIAAISGMTPVIASMAATGGAAIVGLTSALTVAGVAAGVTAMAFSSMGGAIEAANAYAMTPTVENLRKLEQATKDLSAAEAEMAKIIGGQLQPAYLELQRISARGMMPGAVEGLKEMLQLMPAVNNTVRQVSEAMGELSRDTGEALNDGVWRRYIGFIGNEARTQILGFGAAFGKTIEGIAAMQMAFNPFTQDIIAGLQRMATEFSNWAQSLEGSAGFAEFMDYIQTVGPRVMDTFGALAGAIASLIEAGAPLAPFMLNVIRAFADFVSFVADIPVLGTALMGLATAIGVLNLALRASAAIQGSRVYQWMTGLGTQARGAAAGVTALGAASAASAGGVNTASNAAQRGTGVMGALGRAGGALARNLPIVGAVAFGLAAAYDEMNLSASEGADALVQSGAAAAQNRQELTANTRKHEEYVASMGPMMGSIREWMTSLLGTETTLNQANAALEEQIQNMTPLEAATTRQQIAQNQLNDAIRLFGPTSFQAAEAQRNLRNATEETQVQQELSNLTGQEYINTLRGIIDSGGAAGAAGQRIAAGLNLADLAALGATVSINGMGQAVARMPDGKQIILEADGQNATYQINMVAQQVQNLPLNRTINVGAIGQPAFSVLQQIGLEVTRLPDGTVTVTARDEAARAKLQAFVAFGNEQRANPQLDANTEPGRQRLLELINEANAARGLPMINANTAEGQAALNGLINLMNESRGTAQLGADTTPADESAAAWNDRAQGYYPTPNMGADATGAHATAWQWNAETNQLEPIPNIGADSGPATAEAADWENVTANRRPVPNIDANNAPATGEAQAWENETAARRPVPNVDANTGDARSAVDTFIDWVSYLNPVVTVTAILNRLFGEGDITSGVQRTVHMPMANGGVVFNDPGNHLSPYNRVAQGKKLRNMPAGGARMIAPNTWRVVGDRMDVPELYAPLDGSPRSLGLIAQGARTFGYNLVKSDALYGLSSAKKQEATGAFGGGVPQRVDVRHLKSQHVSGDGGHTTNNYVTVNNPIAERASDSVQRELSKMADLGLFGDD